MTATAPILLTGPDRSGTTLLYALLGSHPDVSMVRRTNMWRWFDGRFGDLAAPHNLDRCLDVMLRYERLDVLEPDEERIRAAFAGGAKTYGRLFDIIHRQHAERHGRARWADKSLHTEFHADRVFAELPGARMVHMVRDPRDRYASIIRRYEDRGKGPGAIMGGWLASMRQGERNAARHPARYLFVRYETLARSPETTLRTVCDFLDLDFVPEMLGMGAVADSRDFLGNSSFGALEAGTISTRPIGRYRTALTARQIAFIQACAGRRMAAHGYGLDELRLAGRDRLAFYAVDAPLGFLRVSGWMAARRLDDRRSADVPERRLRSHAPA
jgi:hypothetical protein